MKINEWTNICNSIEEVIKSEDFTRAFEIILNKALPLLKKEEKFVAMNIDSDYFLKILKKIQNGDYQNFSWQAWKDFSKLINNELFEKTAQEVYNKSKWFTLEEAKHFLENYPLEKIKNELVERNKELHQLFIQ